MDPYFLEKGFFDLKINQDNCYDELYMKHDERFKKYINILCTSGSTSFAHFVIILNSLWETFSAMRLKC